MKTKSQGTLVIAWGQKYQVLSLMCKSKLEESNFVDKK